ncbi:MAG TPA: hypothetical protein VFV99_09385 [Kofleriaceae bacterium]|nr:hypothetical protein [Kofleriaceae bacterium]
MWTRCLTLIVVGGCGRIAFDPLGVGSGSDVPQDASGREFASVVAGNGHTCVLSNRGEVACWGDNQYGKLGIGDAMNRGDAPDEVGLLLPRPDFGTVAKPTALTTTSDFSCALLSDDTAKCWGNNDGAQLGVGDYQSRGDMPGEMGDQLPTVQLAAGTHITALVVGHYHGCALVAGSVRCWGSNDTSQNGYGDSIARDTVAELTTLPAVDLGPGFTVAKLSAGFNWTCAISTAQTVKCWGYQPNGELGLGDTQTRGDAPSDMGAALPVVDVGAPVDLIDAGYFHACALLADRVKCWGGGANGALGSGNMMDRGVAPGQMGAALPFVDLGTNARVTALSAGDRFTCAVLVGGDVKCWGYNNVGQLGLGDVSDRGDAPGEMGDALPRVPLPGPARAVAVGTRHACAILVSGGLVCWGSNANGQLGRGDTQNRGDQPNELDNVIMPSQLWPDP